MGYVSTSVTDLHNNRLFRRAQLRDSKIHEASSAWFRCPGSTGARIAFILRPSMMIRFLNMVVRESRTALLNIPKRDGRSVEIKKFFRRVGLSGPRCFHGANHSQTTSCQHRQQLTQNKAYDLTRVVSVGSRFSTSFSFWMPCFYFPFQCGSLEYKSARSF